MSNEKEIMTIRDVAEYLRVSRNSVYKLIKTGKIPYKRIFKRVRFNREDMKEWMSGK